MTATQFEASGGFSTRLWGADSAALLDNYRARLRRAGIWPPSLREATADDAPWHWIGDADGCEREESEEYASRFSKWTDADHLLQRTAELQSTDFSPSSSSISLQSSLYRLVGTSTFPRGPQEHVRLYLDLTQAFESEFPKDAPHRPTARATPMPIPQPLQLILGPPLTVQQFRDGFADAVGEIGIDGASGSESKSGESDPRRSATAVPGYPLGTVAIDLLQPWDPRNDPFYEAQDNAEFEAHDQSDRGDSQCQDVDGRVDRSRAQDPSGSDSDSRSRPRDEL